MHKLMVLAVLLAFGLYSGYAMWQHGYLGIWQAGFTSLASLQILLDLVIACLLLSGWMVADARAKGLNPWPFVGITLAAGSFGPLLYLAYRDRA